MEARFISDGVRAAPPLQISVGRKVSRREHILMGIDLAATAGMEVGPLCSPMVTHQEGEIFYVDFATKKYLSEKYRDDKNIDPTKLVDVDGIWGQQSLTQCVGGKKFEYVVASHVGEHVPDLITWLEEIASVLKSGGSLRLALPDKRYMFDYARPETQTFDLVAAWLGKSRKPTLRQVLEHYELARRVDVAAAWKGPLDIRKLVRLETVARGMNKARNVALNDAYEDVHCWVFTPQSLAANFVEVAAMGLLKFKCDLLIPTQGGEIEFFLHMSVSNDQSEIIESWRRAEKIAALRPRYTSNRGWLGWAFKA